MAPGSISYHICFQSTFICIFTFLHLYYKIPKIYLSYHTIFIRSHFRKCREGIDNPFIVLVASSQFVCVGAWDFCGASYWIDTLVLKNRGKYLRYFVASPFPLQGKTNASSRGSKKDFRRRCRGDLRQFKPYQVPIINSSPSHYIISHLPLVFPSPTSPLLFYCRGQTKRG